MPLYLMVLVVLAISGVSMASLHLAFRSPRSEGRRIREEKQRTLEVARLLKNVLANSLFSVLLVFAIVLGLEPFLFYPETPSWGRMALEVVGVLALYDLLYYWMHRYAFHRWGVLRAAHSVHHVARFPTAVDSLYLHPVETFLGLAVLALCTFVVGPVSSYSFAVIFLVYSQLNIVIHCGLELPAFPFGPLLGL